MVRAIIDESNWVRCGACRHKLFKIVGAGSCDPSPIIEIKCHSCKEVNTYMYEIFHIAEECQDDK